MKVLMVHNRYQQRGGEDAVVDAEARLLSLNGIDVRRMDVDNDSIQGTFSKIQTSLKLLVASPARNDPLAMTLEEFRPDIVHVHNWFPTVSPSVFKRCRQAGIPVVHTLHNYRLVCINALLFRDGHVCEDCVGTALRVSGVIHKCYRDSRLGSAVATAGMLTQWAEGTWHQSVDRFIALSEFSRMKLVQGGLPKDKIAVKPNFVDPDPGPGGGNGSYFLYVGRLSEEKGIRILLDCWKGAPDLPLLRIVGVGPLLEEVMATAACLPNVEWFGARSSEEVAELMGCAKATVCPSVCYEGMPRAVIESLAVGTPVLASRIGCYPEMITDGESGVLFAPGDACSLRSKVRNLEAKGAYSRMRHNARRRFEANYTGKKNLATTLTIYRSVMFAGTRASSVQVSAAT
ncbi:MAG: glycosyltransferase family 4 protein [Terracidiphilus sp.]